MSDVVVVLGKVLLVERRSDGWPFCPVCEEDELWCHDSTALSLSRAPIEEWIARGMSCYRCGTEFPAGTFSRPKPEARP
jgi:hypothetical protein